MLDGVISFSHIACINYFTVERKLCVFRLGKYVVWVYIAVFMHTITTIICTENKSFFSILSQKLLLQNKRVFKYK